MPPILPPPSGPTISLLNSTPEAGQATPPGTPGGTLAICQQKLRTLSSPGGQRAWAEMAGVFFPEGTPPAVVTNLAGY